MTAPAEVTAGYRSRLLTQRALAAQAVAEGLRQLDLDLPADRLRPEMLRWAAAAASLTIRGQTVASSLSATYLAAWLSASQVVEPLPSLDVDARVGLVPDDVPGGSLDDAMRRAAFAVVWRMRSAPVDEALRYGSYAATRVTVTALQDNATGVLGDGMTVHPRVVGYRRITSTTACERCVLAADRQYKTTEPMKRRHPSCRCTQEPILAAAAST